MTVAIPPGLANGTYSLLWRTLSTVDGHTAQGYLPFTIGTDADVRIVAPPAVETTAGALPEWALSVARWLALLGMAAVAAVWPVWLFVVRPAISPAWQLGPKLTRRVRRYTSRRVRLLPAGQPRGAGRAGGSHFRTGGSPERFDDDARRYPLWHLVAGARRCPARFRRGLARDRVVVAVAETAGHHPRPRGQRGAAAAVCDDLPRRGGARGPGDRGRLRLRAPPRRFALGGWAPLSDRRNGADGARPHGCRAARGPGSRPAAVLAAGVDRLGSDGVHRALLRLAPGRQRPGSHRNSVRADADLEAHPDRAPARPRCVQPRRGDAQAARRRDRGAGRRVGATTSSVR